MVIGVVAVISAILSAVFCVCTDSFVKASWLWLFPVGWLGCFLGIILLVFLMILVMCALVDIEKEEKNAAYGEVKVTALVKIFKKMRKKHQKL